MATKMAALGPQKTNQAKVRRFHGAVRLASLGIHGVLPQQRWTRPRWLTSWGLKGEEQGEESCWVRKIVVPVALWKLQFLECHWFTLAEQGVHPKERAAWPSKGHWTDVSAHKRPFPRQPSPLLPRTLLNRCEGLLSATVEPRSRALVAQHWVLT